MGRPATVPSTTSVNSRIETNSTFRRLQGRATGRGAFTSAPPRGLDGGDVDLLHRHHCREGTLCLTATSRKRVGQHARDDLPGEAPPVLAPAALTLLAAIADDRVPVAVRLFLIVRCDLEGKSFAVLERRPAVEAET